MSVDIPEGWRREGRRQYDSRAAWQGGRGREGRRPENSRAAGQGGEKEGGQETR